MHEPLNITLLVVAVVLLAAFPMWMHRQERAGRPCLVPNSLWLNKVFTCSCINVFLIWAVFNSVEQYLNFFFQTLQGINPLRTAIRFLPTCIAGAFANLTMGFVVHRVRGDWILYAATTLSWVAPLLMAVARPGWTYWAGAFPATALNALQVDAFYTIANLLITAAFPQETQALAGGVFNTVSQIGKSVGLALSALVAQTVTSKSGASREESLLEGYQAAFWFCFALCLTTQMVSVWGLHGIGKVGTKNR
jgi:Na+/melibiose symporter-like transporter